MNGSSKPSLRRGYSLVPKKRKKLNLGISFKNDYKESVGLNSGFWMANDRNVIEIPSGASPGEALAINAKLLIKTYPYILSEAEKYYYRYGSIDTDFWTDDLPKHLLDTAGWTLVHDGKIHTDYLNDRLLRLMREPFRKLGWNPELEIVITEFGRSSPLIASVRDIISSTEKRLRRHKSAATAKESAQENSWYDILMERSYKELVLASDTDRKDRAEDVLVRPPRLTQDKYGRDVISYNFKSAQSTTGQRQKGIIVFLSDEENEEADNPVEVVCSCPDYKYRWYYTNWKDGSAPTPNDSKTRSFPSKTNPSGDVGMCKHLLAAYKYIRGAEFI